jgi:putative membrane protein
VVVALICVFYWWAFTQLGPKQVAAGEAVYSRRNLQWVVAGVLFIFVWSYWPLHDISEKYLFMVHMVQHSIFTMVAPICFLLGAPRWMWRWVMNSKLGPFVKFGSKPLLALLIFNALIAGTHFPAIVERSLHNELFHFVVHAVLFSAATLMWIPVVNREKGLPIFKKPTKMVYLFAQSIVPTVPASFLTFSTSAMYPTYGKAPRMISGLDALGDQQIAAAIMKLGVGSLLWAIVGYMFFTWWTESKANLADDNVLSVPKTRERVAGMTISGARVQPLVTVGASEASLSTGDVLTWDQVEAEFARLDAEPKS